MTWLSPQIAAAILTLTTGLAVAQGIPPSLAGFGGALYKAATDQLAATPEGSAERRAIERTREVLAAMRLRNYPTVPPRDAKGLAKLAQALGLDPDSAATMDLIAELLKSDPEKARERLAERLKGAALDEAQSALIKARAAGVDETTWTWKAPSGESVQILWLPETGRLTLAVASDEQGDRFETAISGRTETRVSRDTGALEVVLQADNPPLTTLTEADFVIISRSIFGDWTDNYGRVWTISPATRADKGSGDVSRSAARIRDEIRRLEAEVRRLNGAKEFVWFDPKSEKVVRQSKFRRLDPPWEFRGEATLDPDAKTKIAKAQEEIAKLKAELTGADLPPVRQHDPIGWDEAKKSGGTPVQLVTTLEDGWKITWDEAGFDGRTLRGRHTKRDRRDLFNPLLPANVVDQLVSSWSPPGWMIARARIEPKSRTMTLVGEQWGLHVTWSGDTGAVQSIHTPYAMALSMTRKADATEYKSAWGAADTARP